MKAGKKSPAFSSREFLQRFIGSILWNRLVSLLFRKAKTHQENRIGNNSENATFFFEEYFEMFKAVVQRFNWSRKTIVTHFEIIERGIEAGFDRDFAGVTM